MRGDRRDVTGRVWISDESDDLPKYVLRVMEDASRLHPASVAGLVVGAMGCFIFGLYLRRWLREKKALASEPPGDMIA